MRIQNMFVKPIDRDLKGVIKVGQISDYEVKQELEEYVVTRELEAHFRDFFTAYKKGINGTTDAMGVWVSGFFGSGKSHFLKILSYLLENREVYGKKAIEYFSDDNKIRDPMLLADMRQAANVPGDIILFNIDSKSEAVGKENKDAIVATFLKVFNEKLGYFGSNPHIADLERNLDEIGRYEEFKETFEDTNGIPWEEARNDFDFLQDDVIETLVSMDYMSEEAARNWAAKAMGKYEISIESFAKQVKKHIDSKGGNYHVVFLVDEIGQYIGADSRLMLNLQTVTEELGIKCGGKAWIIVTSQQNIDEVTNVVGYDFSKIQGRFDTRISLSSADVDEVIKKRILEKNETARQTLAAKYEEKSTVIKNLIVFTGSEKKLYSGKEDFINVYPFVPYQFNLLGSVLTAIRTYGAAGAHLAECERSMLAMFKESAMRIMDKEHGALVPFNLFYDALEEFVDSSHRSVISNALRNDYLNPNHEAESFEVNVLKTLFLIKYVNKVEPKIDEITSLMVSNLDDDRLSLKAKVEKALKKLVHEMLVSCNSERYIFLTNEEQEVNRAIESQNVEPGELNQKISEIIFDDLYDEKKYRYPVFNGRYAFAFNEYVDERPYKAVTTNKISLKIMTPDSTESRDINTLRVRTAQDKCVLVVLPADDRAFLNEKRTALKIEKYLRSDLLNSLINADSVRNAKRTEMQEHSRNARTYLEENLKNATIFVNGDILKTSSKDIKTRINEGMGTLVSTVYHKLSYIDFPASENDVRKVLSETGQQITLSDDIKQKPNKLALDDVKSYIELQTAAHIKPSLKTLMDRFTNYPYGFIEDDVSWLVARLFKDGEIALFYNTEPVTVHNKSVDDITRYLTRKDNYDKLMTEKKEKPRDNEIKAVKDVMKELFSTSPVSDDEEETMLSFKKQCASLLSELDRRLTKYEVHEEYPGKSIIDQGRNLMIEIGALKYSTEFFRHIFREQDDLKEFAEDYLPVKSFFEGQQLQIFDRALKYLKIYDSSKNYITNDRIEDLAKDISAIVKNKKPYSEISKLPDLLDKFMEINGELLDRELEPVKEVIEDAKTQVFAELQKNDLVNELGDSFNKRFSDLIKKAEASNNVADLLNIKVEANALKLRCFKEISDKLAEGGTPKGPDSGRQNWRKKTIGIADTYSSYSCTIKNDDDIEAFLETIRNNLKERLNDCDELNVIF